MRVLPAESQDEVARLLLRYVGDDGLVLALDDEDRTAVAVSKQAAAHGEFASEEQVRAVWAKHGL